jgi:hypothetical protein
MTSCLGLVNTGRPVLKPDSGMNTRRSYSLLLLNDFLYASAIFHSAC